jgi:hypothetical protein
MSGLWELARYERRTRAAAGRHAPQLFWLRREERGDKV